MAQNIVIAGATFNAVPSIVVPTSGNGNAIFVDPSPTTAAAADVASGKYFFDALGALTQGTASGGGGGGLTSVVRGDFKYTAEGWNTISLPYSGSGYPIAAVIYVKDGIAYGDFYTTIRRYAIGTYAVCKSNCKIAPTYSGSSSTDSSSCVCIYKSSTSDATTFGVTNGIANTLIYNTSTSISNGVSHAFRISGQKEIKVRMVDLTNNTSRYGFLINTDYTYVVIYSS